MRLSLNKLGLVCVLSAASHSAHAYGCTLNITNLNLVYSPTSATATALTGSYSFTCTRTSSEAATLDWDLAADSGSQPSGTTNRVQQGASTDRYNYELYRNTTFINANRWQLLNALRFAGTLNFGTALMASQPATTFHVNFPALQTARPAGVYTDVVAATLRINASTTVLAVANFNVTATTQNTCLISTPPGNLNFGYVAFQATPATTSTVFRANCTPGLSYSIALNAPSNVLLGLSYGLSMSTNPSNVVVPSSLSGTGLTGSGVPQTYNIIGTMAANQAGTCASVPCNTTQPQTLTITY